MGIILQSILALLFVLGLLLLTLWVIKYVQTKAPGCKVFRNLQEGRRLRIIENQKIYRCICGRSTLQSDSRFRNV